MLTVLGSYSGPGLEYWPGLVSCLYIYYLLLLVNFSVGELNQAIGAQNVQNERYGARQWIVLGSQVKVSL